eukprot:Rhum_TRINITY_DN8468_c1_g1::Rhum_TRINITY_DN8468_c1_g1_i1::g.28074::m.28074
MTVLGTEPSSHPSSPCEDALLARSGGHVSFLTTTSSVAEDRAFANRRQEALAAAAAAATKPASPSSSPPPPPPQRHPRIVSPPHTASAAPEESALARSSCGTTGSAASDDADTLSAAKEQWGTEEPITAAEVRQAKLIADAWAARERDLSALHAKAAAGLARRSADPTLDRRSVYFEVWSASKGRPYYLHLETNTVRWAYPVAMRDRKGRRVGVNVLPYTPLAVRLLGKMACTAGTRIASSEVQVWLDHALATPALHSAAPALAQLLHVTHRELLIASLHNAPPEMAALCARWQELVV